MPDTEGAERVTDEGVVLLPPGMSSSLSSPQAVSVSAGIISHASQPVIFIDFFIFVMVG
jgi:hypothetical protein